MKERTKNTRENQGAGAEQKQLALDALADEIVRKNICPELKEGATQLVLGEGNVDADIVFIGEAPGEREDLQGRPFIGASGKFLDLMLSEAGLVRGDTYITNIVKYRPPENRDPSKAEKEAFLPYLVRQLEIIQPKVIVTLGRHSLSSFLPGAVIGEVHGEAYDMTLGSLPVTLVPLFHPAAALYNGSLRQTLIDDFLKIPPLITRRQ